MSLDEELGPDSVLDLLLRGSSGSFKVGSGKVGFNSLEVIYFQTHVGLNFAAGQNDKLLKHLAPVREIFDFEALGFDEIMQRDIDDARVSAELIPYLLDENSKDLIKFFPPIVVMVLPTSDYSNKPEGKYPQVKKFIHKPTDKNRDYETIRAGDVGSEVFELNRPIVEGRVELHDLVRLRLNTNKTKLVIVDGQHRAMALLALYRNLKDGWNDAEKAPFKDYYLEWTPNYIKQFCLTDINLPITLCVVPELCEGHKGDFGLINAARSIFLTLNKNARKVSNSRNILLDDNDIIASFLRRTLSVVKSKDHLSPYSLRIHNVELDQSNDKLKIQSSMAVTGVNHIYYIIEHALLDADDVSGISPRSGRFASRTDLYQLMERLDGENILGSDIAASINRVNYSSDSEEKLGARFIDKYGKIIIAVYEQFKPYEIHNRATLKIETQIESDSNNQLKPILFEGQGIGHVFEAHRENLKRKLEEGYFKTDVPKIEEVSKKLDITKKRVDETIQDFKEERANIYLKNNKDYNKFINSDKKISDGTVSWVSSLYDNTYTTVAFQSAIICGFLGIWEVTCRRNKKNTDLQDKIFDHFEEYIEQLNTFFVPKTLSKFKDLVSIFTGELNMDKLPEWKTTSTNYTFRDVVYRGEMQPKQWPKYRYILLEIWKPTDSNIKKIIETEIVKSREQVMKALYDSKKRDYCAEYVISEENLKKEQMDGIFNKSFDAYSSMLKALHATPHLDKKVLKQACFSAPKKTTDDDDSDLEDA